MIEIEVVSVIGDIVVGVIVVAAVAAGYLMRDADVREEGMANGVECR